MNSSTFSVKPERTKPKFNSLSNLSSMHRTNPRSRLRHNATSVRKIQGGHPRIPLPTWVPSMLAESGMLGSGTTTSGSTSISNYATEKRLNMGDINRTSNNANNNSELSSAARGLNDFHWSQSEKSSLSHTNDTGFTGDDFPRLENFPLKLQQQPGMGKPFTSQADNKATVNSLEQTQLKHSSDKSVDPSEFKKMLFEEDKVDLLVKEGPPPSTRLQGAMVSKFSAQSSSSGGQTSSRVPFAQTAVSIGKEKVSSEPRSGLPPSSSVTQNKGDMTAPPNIAMPAVGGPPSYSRAGILASVLSAGSNEKMSRAEFFTTGWAAPDVDEEPEELLLQNRNYRAPSSVDDSGLNYDENIVFSDDEDDRTPASVSKSQLKPNHRDNAVDNHKLHQQVEESNLMNPSQPHVAHFHETSSPNAVTVPVGSGANPNMQWLPPMPSWDTNTSSDVRLSSSNHHVERGGGNSGHFLGTQAGVRSVMGLAAAPPPPQHYAPFSSRDVNSPMVHSHPLPSTMPSAPYPPQSHFMGYPPYNNNTSRRVPPHQQRNDSLLPSPHHTSPSPLAVMSGFPDPRNQEWHTGAVESNPNWSNWGSAMPYTSDPTPSLVHPSLAVQKPGMKPPARFTSSCSSEEEPFPVNFPSSTDRSLEKSHYWQAIENARHKRNQAQQQSQQHMGMHGEMNMCDSSKMTLSPNDGIYHLYRPEPMPNEALFRMTGMNSDMSLQQQSQHIHSHESPQNNARKCFSQEYKQQLHEHANAMSPKQQLDSGRVDVRQPFYAKEKPLGSGVIGEQHESNYPCDVFMPSMRPSQDERLRGMPPSTSAFEIKEREHTKPTADRGQPHNDHHLVGQPPSSLLSQHQKYSSHYDTNNTFNVYPHQRGGAVEETYHKGNTNASGMSGQKHPPPPPQQQQLPQQQPNSRQQQSSHQHMPPRIPPGAHMSPRNNAQQYHEDKHPVSEDHGPGSLLHQDVKSVPTQKMSSRSNNSPVTQKQNPALPQWSSNATNHDPKSRNRITMKPSPDKSKKKVTKLNGTSKQPSVDSVEPVVSSQEQQPLSVQSDSSQPPGSTKSSAVMPLFSEGEKMELLNGPAGSELRNKYAAMLYLPYSFQQMRVGGSSARRSGRDNYPQNYSEPAAQSRQLKASAPSTVNNPNFENDPSTELKRNASNGNSKRERGGRMTRNNKPQPRRRVHNPTATDGELNESAQLDFPTDTNEAEQWETASEGSDTGTNNNTNYVARPTHDADCRHKRPQYRNNHPRGGGGGAGSGSGGSALSRRFVNPSNSGDKSNTQSTHNRDHKTNKGGQEDKNEPVHETTAAITVQTETRSISSKPKLKVDTSVFSNVVLAESLPHITEEELLLEVEATRLQLYDGLSIDTQTISKEIALGFQEVLSKSTRRNRKKQEELAEKQKKDKALKTQSKKTLVTKSPIGVKRAGQNALRNSSEHAKKKDVSRESRRLQLMSQTQAVDNTMKPTPLLSESMMASAKTTKKWNSPPNLNALPPTSIPDNQAKSTTEMLSYIGVPETTSSSSHTVTPREEIFVPIDKWNNQLSSAVTTRTSGASLLGLPPSGDFIEDYKESISSAADARPPLSLPPQPLFSNETKFPLSNFEESAGSGSLSLTMPAEMKQSNSAKQMALDMCEYIVGKRAEVIHHHHPDPEPHLSPNDTSTGANVCKVKPQQQSSLSEKSVPSMVSTTNLAFNSSNEAFSNNVRPTSSAMSVSNTVNAMLTNNPSLCLLPESNKTNARFLTSSSSVSSAMPFHVTMPMVAENWSHTNPIFTAPSLFHPDPQCLMSTTNPAGGGGVPLRKMSFELPEHSYLPTYNHVDHHLSNHLGNATNMTNAFNVAAAAAAHLSNANSHHLQVNSMPAHLSSLPPPWGRDDGGYYQQQRMPDSSHLTALTNLVNFGLPTAATAVTPDLNDVSMNQILAHSRLNSSFVHQPTRPAPVQNAQQNLMMYNALHSSNQGNPTLLNGGGASLMQFGGPQYPGGNPLSNSEAALMFNNADSNNTNHAIYFPQTPHSVAPGQTVYAAPPPASAANAAATAQFCSPPSTAQDFFMGLKSVSDYLPQQQQQQPPPPSLGVHHHPSNFMQSQGMPVSNQANNNQFAFPFSASGANMIRNFAPTVAIAAGGPFVSSSSTPANNAFDKTAWNGLVAEHFNSLPKTAELQHMFQQFRQFGPVCGQNTAAAYSRAPGASRRPPHPSSANRTTSGPLDSIPQALFASATGVKSSNSMSHHRDTIRRSVGHNKQNKTAIGQGRLLNSPHPV